MSSQCRGPRVWLGAYVLGALEPAERAELETHLADCPACREELAGLAGLPGLLSQLSVDDLDAPAADSSPPVLART
ncbi:MAG: anti-sigma factor family protein, partial [Sciscionella sp.]